jgi:hypothetical protein
VNRVARSISSATAGEKKGVLPGCFTVCSLRAKHSADGCRCQPAPNAFIERRLGASAWISAGPSRSFSAARCSHETRLIPRRLAAASTRARICVSKHTVTMATPVSSSGGARADYIGAVGLGAAMRSSAVRCSTARSSERFFAIALSPLLSYMRSHIWRKSMNEVG